MLNNKKLSFVFLVASLFLISATSLEAGHHRRRGFCGPRFNVNVNRTYIVQEPTYVVEPIYAPVYATPVVPVQVVRPIYVVREPSPSFGFSFNWMFR